MAANVYPSLDGVLYQLTGVPLALSLAVSVAQGRPWLDTFECFPGRVLIIDGELHPDTVAHRHVYTYLHSHANGEAYEDEDPHPHAVSVAN